MNATTQVSTNEEASAPRPERRRHQLFITGNTEYHVRDGTVFAVRRRGEARFLASHAAVGMAVDRQYGAPCEGARLWLVNPAGRVLLTTPLIGVERPPLELVQQYPLIACKAEW